MGLHGSGAEGDHEHRTGGDFTPVARTGQAGRFASTRASPEAPGASAQRESPLKRLVVVADNSLIVEAIRVGLSRSGEFNLVGRADLRCTSAHTIMGVHPDVVLLDDQDSSGRLVELIRELRIEDEQVAVIILAIEIDLDLLSRVFNAGATAAISKATRPMALATLLRETLNGHIFHKFSGSRTTYTDQTEPLASEALPLTKRELQVLQLVAAGFTNGEVARKLWITEQTVKYHLHNIYGKLDVTNRTEASHLAHVNGLVRAKPALTAAS
jgi:DNA-binding NarL/FixJ family response regulator